MMTEKEITNRLVALHTALVEKIECQPWSSPSLSFNANGRHYVHMPLSKDCGSGKTEIFFGETIAEALDAADAFVADMPDPEARRRAEFMQDLAAVIEMGEAANVPTEVVELMRQVPRVIHQNALFHEPAE